MLKALKATAYHMNEGHAVLALERIRILIQEEGLNFDEARQLVASSIFTTHTPVPAGIDTPRIKSCNTWDKGGHLCLSRDQPLALGRENTGDLASPLSMAVSGAEDICQWCCPAARCGVAEMFHGLAAEPGRGSADYGNTNGFMLVVVLPNRLRSCTTATWDRTGHGIGEPNVEGLEAIQMRNGGAIMLPVGHGDICGSIW